MRHDCLLFKSSNMSVRTIRHFPKHSEKEKWGFYGHRMDRFICGAEVGSASTHFFLWVIRCTSVNRLLAGDEDLGRRWCVTGNITGHLDWVKWLINMNQWLNIWFIKSFVVRTSIQVCDSNQWSWDQFNLTESQLTTTHQKSVTLHQKSVTMHQESVTLH